MVVSEEKEEEQRAPMAYLQSQVLVSFLLSLFRHSSFCCCLCLCVVDHNIYYLRVGLILKKQTDKQMLDAFKGIKVLINKRLLYSTYTLISVCV